MIVAHTTNEELDFRSLTVLGLSSKPNSTSPIGKFGTGLKNAICVLLRSKIDFELWIGTTMYKFHVDRTIFRDQTTEIVYARKKSGSVFSKNRIQMPFTLNYARNWRPWMAYREIYANTVDEKGVTQVFENYDDLEFKNGTTVIVVNCDHTDPAQEYLICATTKAVFLDNTTTAELDVTLGEPSKILYNKGMRVFLSQKPTRNTYSINTNLYLTEERVFPGTEYYLSQLAKQIAKSDDEDLIRSALSADKEFLEHELEFNASMERSSTFRRIASEQEVRNSSAILSVSAAGSILSYLAPAPWSCDHNAVFDANGNLILMLTGKLDGSDAGRSLMINIAKHFGLAAENTPALEFNADPTMFSIDEIDIPF
jgi:hypothetical protein